MAQGRDSQRTKLYTAELMAFGYLRDADRISSIREAQRLSNEVTSSRWWRALGAPKFVLIKGTRSDAYTSTALGRRNEIHLAPNGMTNWVLMHELAHIAMFHIDRHRPSHGPDYAAVYRRLIGRFISDQYRLKLDLSFEANRVSSAATSPRVLKALAAATETEV